LNLKEPIKKDWLLENSNKFATEKTVNSSNKALGTSRWESWGNRDIVARPKNTIFFPADKPNWPI